MGLGCLGRRHVVATVVVAGLPPFRVPSAKSPLNDLFILAPITSSLLSVTP